MSLALKPAHATVKAYYETLHQYGQLHIDHEGAVRSAFQDLLTKCGKRVKLTFVPEYPIERARSFVRVDGALVDLYHLPHGYWEAKDEKDDLAKEVQRKLDKGYPRDNIIFQAPERAILYQSGARIFDENISRPEPLVEVVNTFFDYKAPHIQEWEEAVRDFSERIPELATAVKKTIDEEKKRNPAFVHSFEDFYALCRQAINPNLSEEAVERMLVQHLLTERIFRRIFNNPDFTRRNVVAAEIEKVIVELTKRAFNRDEFLSGLDRFYRAIEQSAENTTGYTEKQHFLNTVYQRFFQGYSPKEADTHGIVYTPQPIVNFMVRSVEEILQKEFGRSLGDKGVHILDPFVGTGNFIVRIMQGIKTLDLPYKYENELHCNEVMLLPYYIASMNIEHAYFDRTGEYKPFPGICLVDTFELAEPKQSSLGFMTAENAERVKREKESPIFVIIGNPPYNMGQVNENDNNKNRRYPAVDHRIAETYSKDSTASLKNKLSDAYVKAFRWASDRIGSEGVIAFVSNNSFLDNIAFDGMRKHLEEGFSAIYHVNLKGNARTAGERRRREAGNVFSDAIRVGVGITVLVRKDGKRPARISYYAVDDYMGSERKLDILRTRDRLSAIQFGSLLPDSKHTWITEGQRLDFEQFLPMGTREAKTGSAGSRSVLFSLFSLGVASNRDLWIYNFQESLLEENVTRMVANYNSEVARYSARGGDIDGFVNRDERFIKWTDRLKEAVVRGERITFERAKIRRALYRPFDGEFVYFDHLLNQRRYLQYVIFPTPDAEGENVAICLSGLIRTKPFHCIASSRIPDLHLTGDTQCFPFYTYAEGGTNRRENITDWALEQFRAHYADPSITKWDIFHYVYAVLHHPEYRQRYAANLRRELPRIPFVSACHPEAAESSAQRTTPNEGPMHLAVADKSIDPSSRKERAPQDDSAKGTRNGAPEGAPLQTDLDVFRAFVRADQRLAEIHVHYEDQAEYPLTKTEKAGEKLDYRVTKMKLSKDKSSLIYNQFLTLSGIPKETYEYRLGNRSALEWVIDQYQVSTDKRSGITNDPNRAHGPQYILRLIGQVITVSLETVKIVHSLPPLSTTGGAPS
jgi:predicted helicase